MSLRIAHVVPVPYRPGEDAAWARLAHRWIPIGHARAEATLGHDVHLFFEGPPRDLALAPGVTGHVRPARVPAAFGVSRSPHLVLAAARLAPDVVHVHHVGALESLLAAAALGLTTFAEFHGGAPSRWGWRRGLSRAATARLAGVFVAAPAYGEQLVQSGLLHADTPRHVSPEATARFTGAPRPRTAGGPPTVLVVGRCEPPKAPFETLAVLRAIAARRRDVRIVWASPGGRDVGAVRAALDGDPALRARVELGPRPRDEMAAIYAAADVTVATSEREIGGTVLAESLSQGTPFAAFSLPTFVALAGESPAVRLTTRRVDRLAEAALGMIGQPDLRDEARARYEAGLSFAAIARHRTALYASATSG